MRIASTGFVGIGTDNPINLLSIANASPRLQIKNTDTEGRFLIDCADSVGGVAIRADQDDQVDDTKISFYIDGEHTMSIVDTGSVGIGITEPDAKLDVNGNVKATNVALRLAPEDPNNYTTTTEEYEEIIQVPVEDGVATADLVNGAPEQQFEQQTVTRTRETKTYTGPTLDVKETLLALTGALENLKTAAASATTCDELRTAIETALANI